MAEDFVGARVRAWRLRRGMSQQALADLVGVSQGYVSQIESGVKEVDKRSTLVRFADALRVSVADLTGQPYLPADPQHMRALTAIPDIRAALIGLAYLDLPAAPSRSIEELAAEVDQLMLWRQKCEYAKAAHVIADLLRDLGSEAYRPKSTNRAGALRLLTLTTYTTAFVLKYLGYVDLSLSAAERCHTAAIALGEPEWIGLAEFTRLHTLPPESRSLGRKLAAATAGRLQADLDRREVRQVYGMLHLTSAWAAALCDAADSATAHLAQAAEVAQSLGPAEVDGGFAKMHFGPTNVEQWRASIALESGNPGKAVELAQRIDTAQIHSTSRLAQFHVDLGCALAAGRRQDSAAVAHFVQAERVAPQRVRLSPAVRETVGAMLRRARADAGGDHLRELAGRVGVA